VPVRDGAQWVPVLYRTRGPTGGSCRAPIYQYPRANFAQESAGSARHDNGKSVSTEGTEVNGDPLRQALQVAVDFPGMGRTMDVQPQWSQCRVQVQSLEVAPQVAIENAAVVSGRLAASEPARPGDLLDSAGCVPRVPSVLVGLDAQVMRLRAS